MIRNDYPRRAAAREAAWLLGLSWAFILVLAAGVHADTEAGEKSFVEGMSEVRALMESRDWRGAKVRLLSLLGEHEGKDYVLFRLSEIREELKRCAVRMAIPQPRPKTLVSGTLLSYSPVTGSIYLRYRPGELDDFTKNGDFLLHPISFSGTYTIEIKGEEYAGSPVIAVGLEGDRNLQIVFGSYVKTSLLETWSSAMVVKSVGGKNEILEEVEKPKAAKDGEEYALKVTVNDTRVTATYNGRRHLSAKKDRDWWGQFGVSALPPFDEIVIRGKAGTAWIRGLIDASTRDAEREFLSTYDVELDLPKWLRDQEAPQEKSTKEELLPWRVFGDQIGRAEGLTAKLADGRYEDALREIAAMSNGDLPADLRIYFAVSAYVGLRIWHKAVELNTGLVKRNPDYIPVRVLQASLLAQVGSREEAIEECRHVIALDPKRADTHKDLAELYLLEGKLPRARDVVLDARKAGIRSPQIDRIDAIIAKAARGPNWNRTYDYETDHYHIVSDIDRKTCYEAGKELEAAYVRYEKDLGPLERAEGKKSRVYLFSGQAGYEAYLDGLFDTSMQSTAGMYSYGLKQLLIWNLPARAEMMETVRHEAVHQYLDELGTDSPTWLNEGLAEYLAILAPVGRSRSRVTVGGVEGEHARLLARNTRTMVPLSTFLYLEGAAFYLNMELHYAQAWAFVHFLRHGGDAKRKLYDAVMAASRARVGKKRAVDQVFGSVDLGALDREFREYITSVTESSGR